ncbi:MAG: radical SAM protein [Candidatus Absconditabacteria bacterium]
MYNKELKLSAPIKVTFNITNKCNFKCIHCYNDSGININFKDSELSIIKIKLILDELKSIGVIFISINGGEPLIRNDIFEILKYCKKLGFIVNLNTNGSLITYKVATQLYDIGITDIDISYHVDNEEHFQEFTLVKGFDKVKKGIANLIKVGILPSIAMTITNYNADFVHKSIKELSKIGINSIHTIVLVERGRAKDKKLTINKSNIKKVYKNLLTEGKKYGISLSLDCPFNLGEEEIRNDINGIKLKGGCFGGLYIACIQANGDVTPCALFPDYIVGNVNASSFKEIWQKDDMAVLSLNRFKLNSKCKKCKLLDSCYGGCPTSNYTPNGFLPDYFCPFNEQ